MSNAREQYAGLNKDMLLDKIDELQKQIDAQAVLDNRLEVESMRLPTPRLDPYQLTREDQLRTQSLQWALTYPTGNKTGMDKAAEYYGFLSGGDTDGE